MRDARVSLVGVGTIADPYVQGLRSTPGFEVVSVCSRDLANADRFAAGRGLRAEPLDTMLADPSINYVLNLTPAQAHADVTSACLEAGKSVYSEKPLASTLAAADGLIALAERRGLLLACAPATFLWPPLTTARRLVEQGALGRVTGALSTLIYPGPELFHPHPEHLYGPGAGPLHDMGVYQVTALTALLGPVTEVTGMGTRAGATRTVRVGPEAGRNFAVEGFTQIHAHLRHAGGAISSVVVSFDGVSVRPPCLDIFGHDAGLTLGSAHLPTAELWLKRYGCDPEHVALDQGIGAARTLAIGPTSAWAQHQAGATVDASASRARGALAVLTAIERTATMRQVVEPLS